VLALAYFGTLRPEHALGSAAQQRYLGTPWLDAHGLRSHRARSVAPRPTLGVRAVSFARRLLGAPYSWGGESPRSGFDCSGFVRFVYGHFGLTLPHSSYADFNLGVRVPRSSLRPGDLVFFDGIGHVGLYVGDGRFIHAPHSGTHVQITSLDDPWYRSSYDGARRLISHPLARARRHLGGRTLLTALPARLF
jgi:cell wall-associated NlpC family hydrolase